MQDEENEHQACVIGLSSQLKVSIMIHLHPETDCVTSWGLTPSASLGPSAMNHMNLIVLKSCHQNCDSVSLNVACFVQMTGVLIVVDIVSEVGKSHIHPTNVI
jgi:hypothetical protein